ncbi:helix-turn-helix transcriptional regulator [Nonomuraea rhizosphaerae]|uniref:helix-turn-helix transcriptional regulator n=1 Tax=Nonomuraea rhizosphaerae TaxID=2665663 RepID=UPI001C5EE021|nr:LuxR C-terminal-related transcriptional regulator [Nonomuraea rhizosphaerae]
MLDLAGDLIRSRAPEQAWPLVVAELAESLRGNISLLAELDWRAGAGRMVTGVPDLLHRVPMDSLITAHMHVHPLMRLYASGHEQVALTLDQVAGKDWYRSAAFRAGRDAIGITRQLAVPLRAPSGHLRSLIVGRDGSDFGERDQEYARRLQPLLNALDAHLYELGRHQDTLPRERGDPSEFGLTQREVVVLGLLAEGLTAHAIARRLAISPRTVTKHQQNLYRKLRTRDRLATVLVAQRLGLLAVG